MDLNQQQAERIQRLGLVAPEHLQRAIQLTQPGKDLCAVLFEQGILPAELLPQIRRRAGSPKPHHSQIRSQVVQALASISNSDPHFAPHITHVLERKEELGRGGMGVVYRVWDKRLKREAALKLLLSGRDDPDDHLRFQREAEVMAQLDHPAIPPIYEMGMTPDGESFMLMKVVEGVTLKERIHKFQFTDRDDPELLELLRSLVKVSEAMAFAHSKGILHRDLKPSNIMIGEFGEVQIMDWGLCRKIGQGESRLTKASLTLDPGAAHSLGLTQEGAVLGTPGYMSPEQISGGHLDERVDIFAFGSVLTELLTGRPSIEGSTPLDCLVATMHSEIETPRQRDPSIPEELDLIAAHCLEVDLDQRSSSMEEVGRQLLSFIEKREQKSGLFATLGRSGLFFILSLLVLALSSVLFTFSTMKSEPQTASETKAAERETEQRDQAERPRLRVAPRKLTYVARVLPLLKKQLSVERMELELNDFDEEIQSPKELMECWELCERLRLRDYQRSFLVRAERLFPKSNMVLFKLRSIYDRPLNPALANFTKEILNSGIEDEYYFATKALSRFIELNRPGGNPREVRGEVMALIDKAIELNAKDGDLYFVAGKLAFTFQQPERAIEYFSKAIQRRSSNGKFYFWRAKTEMELVLRQLMNKSALNNEALESAIADAKIAIRLDRRLVAADIIVARGLVMSKNNRGARLAFLQAQQNENATPRVLEDALVGLASICEGEGNFEAAINYCREALKITGDFRIEMTLARLVMLKGDYKEAIRMWSGIVRRRGDSVARVYLARSYVGQEYYRPAIDEIVKVNVGQLRGIEVYEYFYCAGLAYSKASRFRKAVPMLLEALREAPKSIEARIELIHCYVQLKDFQSARDQLKEAKRLQPKDIRLVLAEVSLERARQKYPAAILVCKKALVAGFDKATLFLELARVHMDQGRIDLAEVKLNQTVQLNERDARPHFMLGEIFQKKGKGRAAYMAFFKAFALDYPDVGIQLKLGGLSLEMKDYGSAVFHYSLFIRKTRTFSAQAHIWRAQAYKELGNLQAALKDVDTTLQGPMGGSFAIGYFARAGIYEKMGKPKLAISDYESFLDLGKNDDRLKIEKQLARFRLESLKKQ